MDAARLRRRTMLGLLLAAGVLAALPSPALAATIPVRIRIIKGSRQGPAAVDPRLADLQLQLGPQHRDELPRQGVAAIRAIQGHGGHAVDHGGEDRLSHGSGR